MKLVVCVIISLFVSVSLSPLGKSKMENDNLFEGDIDLEYDSRGVAKIPTATNRWANGIVPYVINSSYSSTQKRTILSGMKLIEDKTRVGDKDCIKFVPRTDEPNYLFIKDGNGCHSKVGKISGSGPQELSLETASSIFSSSCMVRGTVAHELIHALGFWHEQSRPDRDDYVKIEWDNVSPGKEHNFNKYDISHSDTMDFPYDYNSIMHYDWNAFSKSMLKATIVPVQSGVVLAGSSYKSLSDIDVAEIRKYYNCA